jgi:hypothetical protein
MLFWTGRSVRSIEELSLSGETYSTVVSLIITSHTEDNMGELFGCSKGEVGAGSYMHMQMKGSAWPILVWQYP